MTDCIWQPSASFSLLRRRACLLTEIRDFFAQRGVLEVETPLLSLGIGTDPHLAFFTVPTDEGAAPRYLQTSPEFAMKRLLAAGSGDIYQICKAFRQGEAGRWHNPEFTLLEWYRVGFDLNALIDEVEALLQRLLDLPLSPARRLDYCEIFLEFTGLDALIFDVEAYRACAVSHGLPEAADWCGEDAGLWLDLLFSHLVQPHLGQETVCFVQHFPAILSSLARFAPHDPRLVERVEVFWRGVELGNGYHELADADEQMARFARDNARRAVLGLPQVEIDTRLITALAAGLPDCSGIALGIDRLLMLMTRASHIDAVLAFPFSRA